MIVEDGTVGQRRKWKTMADSKLEEYGEFCLKLGPLRGMCDEDAEEKGNVFG